jgi:hypothetical protein
MSPHTWLLGVTLAATILALGIAFQPLVSVLAADWYERRRHERVRKTAEHRAAMEKMARKTREIL